MLLSMLVNATMPRIGGGRLGCATRTGWSVVLHEPHRLVALQRADGRAMAGEGAGSDVAVQLHFDPGGA
jgi:hypothetical protein